MNRTHVTGLKRFENRFESSLGPPSTEIVLTLETTTGDLILSITGPVAQEMKKHFDALHDNKPVPGE